MQIITEARQHAGRLLQENATVLLTAGGVVGVVATAVLTGRASFKAAEIIRDEELVRVHPEGVEDTLSEGTMGLDRKTKVKLVWPLFIAPTVTGGVTIASIVMSHRMSAQKAAALAAAYGMSQKHFDEYKEKVTEKLGLQKEQKLQDEVAQDKVNNTKPTNEVIIINGDDVLCFDLPTGRYFRSTMEKINKAVNSTNAEIIRHGFATLSYFYSELELPDTSWGGDVGWTTDHLLELAFTTTMAPDNQPCLAIDFVRLPIAEYDQKMY